MIRVKPIASTFILDDRLFFDSYWLGITEGHITLIRLLSDNTVNVVDESLHDHAIVTMTGTRQRIHEYITAYPGVHFNDIVRTLDLAPGQVQYHIRNLLDDDIVLKRIYGRTHYYPQEYDGWEQGVLALFRRETAREILLYLLEHGSSSPATIVSDLDLARSTLEWHLDHFITSNIIEKIYGTNNQVTITLLKPDRTADLLQEIHPSTSDRFVDRFIQFTDQLFETREE